MRRAQSVAGSISRKIRKKDATGSRKKRLGYMLHNTEHAAAVIVTLCARVEWHPGPGRPPEALAPIVFVMLAICAELKHTPDSRL